MEDFEGEPFISFIKLTVNELPMRGESHKDISETKEGGEEIW